MGLPKFNEDNFEADVLKSDLPVLVDFYTEWCGPCKRIAPIVEDLAQSYSGKVKVGKVDVDQAQGLATRFGIMGVPTLMIFHGGKAVDQIVGLTTKQALEEKIRRIIG